MVQESPQEAIRNDIYQDEGDGSQILEEPEVRQDAKRQPQLSSSFDVPPRTPPPNEHLISISFFSYGAIFVHHSRIK